MTTAEGERAALVSERGLYSDSNGKAPNDEEEDGVIGKMINGTHQPKPHNILGQFHEDALTQVGVGSYQWLMCAVAGFCFMADGVQVFIAPFLENSVQAEMCVSEDEKRWISGIAMLGLFVGSLLCLLADHIGRRPMLLFGLSLHIMFSIVTAATPTIGLFLFTRFLASVGLGICYPVSCIYFAEFLPQNARGRISFLLLFWALGGFYVVLFAGALLPSSADDLITEVKEHKNAWHRVLLLSLLPSIFAFISLIFCSESVRYMLHTGRDVNAIMMYQQMYKWNASRSAQYQLTELELPSKVSTSRPSPDKTFFGRLLHCCFQIADSLRQLLGQKDNLLSAIILSIVWTSLGVSYYSMSQFIPNRLEAIDTAAYESQAIHRKNEFLFGKLNLDGKDTLQNYIFTNVTFKMCTFAHMRISHVLFENCTFSSVDFSNIISSHTFFQDSVIEWSKFIDTDFTPDRFANCRMTNNTMEALFPPCPVDLDTKLRQSDLITENIVKLLAPFATFLLSNTCFSTMRRSNIGVLSLLLGSFSSLIVFFIASRSKLLIFDFIWGVIFLFAFNAVNIITVESYTVNLRATGFGLNFSFFRLAGLCITVHQHFPYVPETVISLLMAGTTLLGLPDTAFNFM